LPATIRPNSNSLSSALWGETRCADDTMGEAAAERAAGASAAGTDFFGMTGLLDEAMALPRGGTTA
jgi:hypothetical protein